MGGVGLCPTSLSDCDDGEQRVRREDEEPPLAGRWISGRGNLHIVGVDAVQWRSGDVTRLRKRRRLGVAASEYATELNGVLYTAYLTPEGHLQWSDGDIWTRDLRAPETGTYSAVTGALARAGESFQGAIATSPLYAPLAAAITSDAGTKLAGLDGISTCAPSPGVRKVLNGGEWHPQDRRGSGDSLSTHAPASPVDREGAACRTPGTSEEGPHVESPQVAHGIPAWPPLDDAVAAAAGSPYLRGLPPLPGLEQPAGLAPVPTSPEAATAASPKSPPTPSGAAGFGGPGSPSSAASPSVGGRRVPPSAGPRPKRRVAPPQAGAS